MSPPNNRGLIIGALIFLGGAGLSGCSALPGAPAPAPTSTSTVATTAAEFGEFSEEELADICIDVTASAFPEDVEFAPENVRIEERTVDPQWLVLVPATTTEFDGQAQCTIGGAPASPEIELSNASIEALPEQQIQNLIEGKNEGGAQ